jgi:hypothetical protein
MIVDTLGVYSSEIHEICLRFILLILHTFWYFFFNLFMYICLQRWKEDHGIKARIMVCLMNVEPCCLRLCIISLKGNHSKVIFRFRFDFFPLIQFTYKKGLVGQNFLYYFFFKFHLFKHVCQMTEIVCLFCVELEPTEPCICIKKRS